MYLQTISKARLGNLIVAAAAAFSRAHYITQPSSFKLLKARSHNKPKITISHGHSYLHLAVAFRCRAAISLKNLQRQSHGAAAESQKF